MADAQSGTETDTQTGTEANTPPDQPEESRSILVESFRQAFTKSDSRLLQSYALVSALLSGLLALILLLALPVWIFNSTGGSELATFSRTFLIVGAVFLLVALVAPLLSSARRRTRGTANARVDLLLALSGYLFVLSLYLALLISAPPDQRGTPSDLVAPVVEFLYSLPPLYAVAPPLLAVVLIALVHRFAR